MQRAHIILPNQKSNHISQYAKVVNATEMHVPTQSKGTNKKAEFWTIVDTSSWISLGEE